MDEDARMSRWPWMRPWGVTDPILSCAIRRDVLPAPSRSDVRSPAEVLRVGLTRTGPAEWNDDARRTRDLLVGCQVVRDPAADQAGPVAKVAHR
jgi:hypothetical protein